MIQEVGKITKSLLNLEKTISKIQKDMDDLQTTTQVVGNGVADNARLIQETQKSLSEQLLYLQKLAGDVQDLEHKQRNENPTIN